MKGWRKIVIFAVCIIVGIAVSFFMKLDFYKEFLSFVSMIAIGFFAGNAISNVGNNITNRRGE